MNGRIECKNSKKMKTDKNPDEVPLNGSENIKIHSRLKNKVFLRKRHFFEFIEDKLKL